MSDSRLPQGVRLDSHLPPTIKALIDGWLATSQNSSVISALFAVVGALMYPFITSSSNYGRRTFPAGAFTFVVLLSYATILFNASAAISSFIVADSLSEIPFRKASFEEDPYPERATVSANQTYLLTKYGAGKMWQPIMWHWLFCYLAGIWCLILQIVTYAILQEPNAVRIPITCVTGFAVLPLIVYIIPSFRSRSHARKH